MKNCPKVAFIMMYIVLMIGKRLLMSRTKLIGKLKLIKKIKNKKRNKSMVKAGIALRWHALCIRAIVICNVALWTV